VEPPDHDIDTRLEGVRARVVDACRRSGRRPEEVRIVGVTKGVRAARVVAARGAGLADLGENYVQELARKRQAAPDAIWHFIGRLQRNKARRILELADVVHSLEPGAAAERLGAVAAEREDPVEALVEVDFTGARVGVPPEEVRPFAERWAGRRGVRLTGLMTIPPPDEDPRPYFSLLRELRDSLGGLPELSMGMSTDYEEAVEEGATMVRIGTAIFGPRPDRPPGSRPPRQ
jgi:pyridoxal phosphate enzyme (YggS family)